ncbi:MAG: tryptophan synthase subunit alpha [bacterium]
MNRIERAFREKERPLLIPYITSGDPSLEWTERLILSLESAGCDIIELGIPFSDPIADGPIIQEACNRALKQGMSLRKAISFVGNLRKKTEIPIVFLSYYNPIYKYGLSNFAQDAKIAGIDGLIVPDLPPEEGQGLKKLLLKNGICLIYLLAPTSTEKRIKMANRESSGFIYYVSLLGVTGIRDSLSKSLGREILRIKRSSNKPICVGFGISKPSHAKEIKDLADGIIIGSKIVSLIAKNPDSPDKAVIPFVSSVLRAIKNN